MKLAVNDACQMKRSVLLCCLNDWLNKWGKVTYRMLAKL